MSSAILVVTILVLMVIGVPVGASLAIGIFALLLYDPVTSLGYIASKMYAGVADFPLIALPFFVLSGALMETGGLSRRLVQAADSLVGNITGGLGVVTVLACMFFGAISGSAPATVAAIGAVMLPQMIKAGYDKGYAMGLIAVAGGLGVIVPPSLPMVIYGVTNDVSIGSLFMAGIGPSIVVGAILIAFNHYYSKKHGYKGSGQSFTVRRALKAFWDSKWALFMPIIILGGIYGGIFTPTEAAVFAVVYGIIVGKFVYKELTWKKIVKTYNHTSAFFAGMILIMAPAVALGPIFSYLQIPEAINGIFLGISQNRYLVLTMIFLILIPVGMFIGPMEIIIILSPILLGVAEKVGVNPVHFGLIMVLNLCVAFVTPPFAVNIFVASQLSGVSLDRLVRVGLPFIIAMMIAALIISYLPEISLALLGVLGVPY